jgi:hypothetical protein
MPKTTKITSEPPDTEPPTEEESVRNLIAARRVCFERWNEFEMVNGVRTHVGYSLRLCGENDERTDDDNPRGGGHPVPGCACCRATYDDLRRVAKWILPKTKRASQYKIESFDYAFHIAPKARNYREEIVVTIQILHCCNPNLPADEGESLSLKEMCGELKNLGVLEGRVSGDFGETPAATRGGGIWLLRI